MNNESNIYEQVRGVIIKISATLSAYMDKHGTTVMPICSTFSEIVDMLIAGIQSEKWIFEFFQVEITQIRIVVMLLNELVRNIKRSDDERELASSIISRLVTNLPFETARFLVTGMVPGMISTYTKVCADEGHKCRRQFIINNLKTIGVLFDIIGPTLDQKEEPSVLNVLTSLNSTLLRSHHDGVRYNVLLLNMKIGTIFGLRYQSIKTPIFFVAAYLDSDPDEETKVIAKQVLQRIQLTDPIVFTTLTTDVVHNYLTAIGMPEYVSNEIEKHLAMILSCLTYFDPRQLENIAIYSRIFIERLAVALAVNIKNVTVLNEDYSDIKNSADFFRKIPFVYVSNYQVILKIGQELNRLEDVVKFFNGMLSTLKNTIDIASQMGYLIVCLAVLIPMEQKDEHEFNSMASSFQQFSMKQLNIYEPRYHKLNKHNAVRSKVESNSNESFYVCLLHVLNCQFILKIKSKQVQSDLLVDTLYSAVSYTSAANGSIRQTTDAVFNDYIQLGLEECVSHLAYKCSSALGDLNSRQYAVDVLTTLIKKVSCEKNLYNIYQQTKYLMKNLIYVIDFGSKDETLNTLQTFYHYIKACIAWFPDLSVETVIEGEGDQNIPDPIITVHEILKRVKNYIVSDSLAIEIMCYDIVKEGLIFMNNFTSQSLPMIHQCYQGPCQKLSYIRKYYNEAEVDPTFFLAATKAIELMTLMTKLSKDFMYHKILQAFGEDVISLIRRSSISTKNAHAHNLLTQKFIFQKTVLINIPLLQKYLNIIDLKDDALFKKFKYIQRIYLDDPSQPSVLTDLAQLC